MPQLALAVTTSMPVSLLASKLASCGLAEDVFRNKLHAFGHLAMVGSWFNAVKLKPGIAAGLKCVSGSERVIHRAVSGSRMIPGNETGFTGKRHRVLPGNETGFTGK
jgi:hypothetical protein